MTPHIYAITTNNLTTTQLVDDYNDTLKSSVKHHTTNMTCDKNFRGYSAMVTNSFFGITHTLMTGVTQTPIKCLASTHARLKDTKRSRYIIVSIKTLLRTLVISVYDNSPLCTQIPYDKDFQFDRILHFKYIKDTKHTVT